MATLKTRTMRHPAGWVLGLVILTACTGNTDAARPVNEPVPSAWEAILSGEEAEVEWTIRQSFDTTFGVCIALQIRHDSSVAPISVQPLGEESTGSVPSPEELYEDALCGPVPNRHEPLLAEVRRGRGFPSTVVWGMLPSGVPTAAAMLSDGTTQTIVAVNGSFFVSFPNSAELDEIRFKDLRGTEWRCDAKTEHDLPGVPKTFFSCADSRSAASDQQRKR